MTMNRDVVLHRRRPSPLTVAALAAASLLIGAPQRCLVGGGNGQPALEDLNPPSPPDGCGHGSENARCGFAKDYAPQIARMTGDPHYPLFTSARTEEYFYHSSFPQKVYYGSGTDRFRFSTQGRFLSGKLWSRTTEHSLPKDPLCDKQFMPTDAAERKARAFLKEHAPFLSLEPGTAGMSIGGLGIDFCFQPKDPQSGASLVDTYAEVTADFITGRVISWNIRHFPVQGPIVFQMDVKEVEAIIRRVLKLKPDVRLSWPIGRLVGRDRKGKLEYLWSYCHDAPGEHPALVSINDRTKSWCIDR